ncbi:GNAT family N-acetyltransferase [Paenibacillus arenilitoris]|uniref:GNAT family N-acetyltransferase n=1 Tax=Paenibacillus arenilitoris TaxID=2772299 RepID=A0A927HAN2_9BACL|nr:GNAT family N-acetyltransferase [Paenibacillus arenilitoris]MBD2872779.1 GNAT family N-acetyltransferase [Paenibacillus arenilitoris]
MNALTKDRYSKAGSVFDGYHHQLIVSSVIDGNTRGEIYVDDIEDPKTGIIHGIGFEVLCSGDPENELFQQAFPDLLVNKLIPNARTSGMPVINIYFPSDSWEWALQRLLSDRLELAVVKKRFYTFDPANCPPRKEIQAHCKLKRIDESLLNDDSLKNRDTLLQWIRMSWLSVDDFARKGVGYCILEDGRIASWCLSVFASGNRLEFALFTDELFRNRGYAKRVSSACVAYCLENGGFPLWVCDDNNIPSIRVAEETGFSKTLDFHVLQVKL